MIDYISDRSAYMRFYLYFRTKLFVRSLVGCIKKTHKHPLSDCSVVEFGPGLGDLAFSLAKNKIASSYLCVDLDSRILDYIEGRVSSFLSFSKCQMDANDTVHSVIHSKFDIVISSHVIEHLNDPFEHLKDLYHLTAPGGYCVLSAPNLDSLNRFDMRSAWRGFEDKTHISLISYHNLEGLVRRAGFEICISGTSPHHLKEIFITRNLSSLFFSEYSLGDSSNFILYKPK